MKRFDIQLEDRLLHGVTEEEIVLLHATGRVTSRTLCRPEGETRWVELNEYFPLLKYGRATPEQHHAEDSLRSSTGQRGRWGSSWWTRGKCALLVAASMAVGAVLFHPDIRDRLGDEQHSPVPPVAVSAASVASATAPSVAAQTPHLASPRRIVRAQEPLRRAPLSSQPPAGRVPQILPAALPLPKPAPAPKIEEVTIPLEKWTTVTTAYGSFALKVRDHGPVTITVWTNWGEGRRIEKVKGFETTATNIVPIHSLSGATVYYVDRISVPLGHCVLKIIPSG